MLCRGESGIPCDNSARYDLRLVAHVNSEAKAALISRLDALRRDDALTGDHVRLAAETLGVAERTVWRWLARDGAGPREGFVPSVTDREAYAFFKGNVAALYRAREAVISGDGTTAGAPVPEFLAEGWAGAASASVWTLRRAFDAELTPAERAAWKVGESGRRAAEVYLKRPDALRGRVWEMDHKQIPLLVLPPKGPAVCPWMTTVVDDGTRALVGWAVALYPHAGTVLTAMRMALVQDPARGDFGAVPELVRIDRGLEFAADSVIRVLGGLAVAVHRLPAFTPHRKGKVERLNLTMEQALLSQLPGFTGGPRDAAGRLYGPLGDTVADRRAAETDQVGPMRIERFVERFAAWANWYNTARPHRSLDDRTPAEAWAADLAPLHRIDAKLVRHLLLADAERVIGKDGIRHNRLHYYAPELAGRGGQTVQIRYMPHDDRFIEVFLGDVHLATAHPSNQMTAEQTEAYREHARAEAKRLGAERRKASRRARAELAPMTDGTAPAESRLLPAHKARPIGPNDAALRAKARSDLLGLHPARAILPKPES